MAVSLLDLDVPPAGGAGEQEQGHAGVSGIEGLCTGRTMGLLQAELLTFNSSLPVTPYGIASWKILVESQEQRKDVRLLLKWTCSQGRGSPLVARVGGSARGTWALLKTGGKSGDIHQTGEMRKGQRSGGDSFASLCSVPALSRDKVCVCLCGKNSYADVVSLYWIVPMVPEESRVLIRTEDVTMPTSYWALISDPTSPEREPGKRCVPENQGLWHCLDSVQARVAEKHPGLIL